tara:strand:- start:14 stop:583 length:570 start_codon:yes stop_codon:yes gene_type:complete
MLGAILGGAATTLLSSALSPKPQTISTNKIRQFQKPTQDLIQEQLGIGRELMDPTSAINMRQRNIMQQRAADTGAQISRGLASTAAQTGMSPGQLAMQQRSAQNTAMGDVNKQFQELLTGQFNRGLGLMGNMTGAQQSLDENLANAYVNRIAQENQYAQQQYQNNMGSIGLGMNMTGGLMRMFPQGLMG